MTRIFTFIILALLSIQINAQTKVLNIQVVDEQHNPVNYGILVVSSNESYEVFETDSLGLAKIEVKDSVDYQIELFTTGKDTSISITKDKSQIADYSFSVNKKSVESIVDEDVPRIRTRRLYCSVPQVGHTAYYLYSDGELVAPSNTLKEMDFLVSFSHN